MHDPRWLNQVYAYAYSTQDVLTAAVQLWIDRLIFIKVLSDREIEGDYLAQMAERVERDGLSEHNFGWFTATRSIFNKLNQIYNVNYIVANTVGELLAECKTPADSMHGCGCQCFAPTPRIGT